MIALTSTRLLSVLGCQKEMLPRKDMPKYGGIPSLYAAGFPLLRWVRVVITWVVVIGALSSCSYRTKTTPPEAALRDRMNRIVLRVYSDATPGWLARDEINVGAGGVTHAAKKGAAGGLVVGGGVALGLIGNFCDPGKAKEFWFFTCPIGVVVGAGAAVGGTAIGGVGGALYGTAVASSKEEIDAAVVSLNKALLRTNVAKALREKLDNFIKQDTSARIIEDPEPTAGGVQPRLNEKAPIVLAIRVDDFQLIRKGKLTPDLWLDFKASAGVYDTKKFESFYERQWNLYTQLGGFVSLTRKDAVRLNKSLEKAIEKMANAIVDDIFVSGTKKSFVPESEVQDRVVNAVTPIRFSSDIPYRRSLAACGDRTAQLEVGKAYAAIDARIYGWRAQEKWIEAYQWLRLAQNAQKAGASSEIKELQKKLSPAQLEAADEFVANWHPSQC